MARHNSLTTALFDFSFAEFVTTRLARVIYRAAIGVAGMLGVVIALLGFGQSPLLGLVGLVVGCAAFLACVVIARVWVEAAVVFFRIADHLAEIVEHEAEIAMNTAQLKSPAGKPTAVS